MVKRGWLIFVVCVGFHLTPAQGASLDTELISSSFNDTPAAFNTSVGDWDFFLSGGSSHINSFDSTIQTEPVLELLNFSNRAILLSFPSRTVSVSNLSNGFAINVGIHRNLASWMSVGLESGVSLGHAKTAESGDIFYFDGATVSAVPYNVEYSAYMLHVTPVIKLGPWIPVGRFALKPYVTGGVGWHQIREKILFQAVGAEFQLGHRNDSSLGTLFGTGLDFRISESGSVGAMYQVQQTQSDNDGTVRISHWLVRFSYLF